MSDFVNTIDVLGDDAVIDSIIDRSITEFKDDKLTSVGDYAFYGCDKLEVVELPNATSIGELAFENCSALKAITSDTFPKVTSLSYCDTSSGHFRGCISLESVEWDSLTDISTNGLFRYCTALRTAKLPNMTVSEYGENLFGGCNLLKSVSLPKVTKLPNATFHGCKSLTDVHLPAVTSAGRMSFYGCETLELLDLPSCVTLGGLYLFYKCFKLKALLLRSESVCVLTDPSATTAIDATLIASGQGYIYVPRDLVDSYKAATNWVEFADRFRALEDYTVDGTTTGELDETKI